MYYNQQKIEDDVHVEQVFRVSVFNNKMTHI